jgi:hypothetical protein
MSTTKKPRKKSNLKAAPVEPAEHVRCNGCGNVFARDETEDVRTCGVFGNETLSYCKPCMYGRPRAVWPKPLPGPF